MRRRALLLGASLGFVVLGLACVDLFHGTEFETLCAHNPQDPSCNAPETSASPDAGKDGGFDAAPAHPDFCKWSSVEALNQARHACAWLGACEGPLGESAVGPCIVRAQLAFDCRANPSLRPRGKADDFWACLSAVTSCGDVDRCVFPGGVQECGGVMGGGTSTDCGSNGNNAVRIECIGAAKGRAKGIEPCAMFGRTCTPEGQGTAACTGTGGFKCTESKCSGTSAVNCQANATTTIDRGVDCASYGAGTCATVSGVDGGFTCAAGPNAPTCTIENVPTCEGTTVSSCVDGKDIRVDCKVLGLECDATKATVQEPDKGCQAPDPPPCAAADKCATATLVQSCGRGRLYELDCASVGLGKCQVGPTGNAFCAPP